MSRIGPTSSPTKDVEGPLHPNFPLLLKMAQARDADGHHVNIFFSGEASSGKTTACKQLAKALERMWYFNGAISMPPEMLGFIDAAGNYHRTPFRDAYEHGGIYTFDEVDRSDPVALLAVNPHLANGVATFPDGQIKRHKDCLIVCTANTWGNGANAEYSARPSSTRRSCPVSRPGCPGISTRHSRCRSPVMRPGPSVCRQPGRRHKPRG